MKVSKTVREYIANEVRERLMPKYQAEKREADRQKNILYDVVDEATAAASSAAEAVISEAINNHAFLERTGCSLENCFGGFSRLLRIRNSESANNVLRWEYHMLQEAHKTTERIIVELELGGTKKDLERLLAEVGAEG